MPSVSREKLNQLLKTENQQLEKLHQIVLKSIEEEKLISQKLYEFDDRHPPLAGRLADTVASFGGSWTFIIIFLFSMFVWMIGNIYLLTKPFDPYPFIFLNLLLSTIAAIQAPLIMMSQNRKEEKDRQRAVNDYLINLKSEIEVRNLHQKLDLLISDQMKTLFDIQRMQMDMMNEIRTKLQAKQSKY